MFRSLKKKVAGSLVSESWHNLLIDVGFASSGFDAGFLGLSELLDMAIHGVLDVRIGQ